MNEKEKKIIEDSKSDIILNAYGYETRIPYKIENLRTLIDLIEKQDKKIKELKEENNNSKKQINILLKRIKKLLNINKIGEK